MPGGFDVSLKVGEEVTLDKKWYSAQWTLVYAGMPSDGVYSIVVAWKEGYQAAAWNLFFPRDQRGFDVAKGHVSVTFVDEKSIRFRYEKL